MKHALMISFGSILVFGAVWLWMSRAEVPAPEGTLPTTTSTPVSSPTTSPHTIIAFGDSITAGYGLAPSEAYPAVLERVLRERGHDVRVINAGVSGETTAGGLRRASFIASQQADIVIVALGGNDMLRGTPPSAVEEQLRQLLTILRTGESRILLVGMRASQNLGPNYVADFDAIYPRLAEEFSVPLVPFLLEGIALDPALNQADGIHPNTRGAELIASTLILPAVELLLPASTSD